MEYPPLREKLDKRLLVEDEKKMWLRIGIYITTEPFFSSHINKTAVILIDSMANETHVGETVGANIRRTVLRWWQMEKIKPRAAEPVDVDPTGLSALESRNI